MGYAKLFFKNDGSTAVADVITEIAKVVTGRSSNTANLVYANASLSTIINTSGRGNWSQLYPAANASGNAIVLTANALNGTTKYCAIGSISSNDAFTLSVNTNRSYSGSNTATGNSGITIIGMQSASSYNSYTNPSLYVANTSTAASLGSDNLIRSNYVYLSWSNRHLIMFGYNQSPPTSAKFCGVGVMEFTENSVYNFLNTAPFAAFSYTDSSGNFETNTVPVATLMRDNSFQIFNYYNVANATSTGVINYYNNIGVGSALKRTTTVLTGIDPVTLTRTSTGAYALPVIPLYWHQIDQGHPLNYMSDLCKVYLTINQRGMPGDELTVGGSTYVYMPVGDTSTTGYPSLTRPAMIVLKE